LIDQFFGFGDIQHLTTPVTERSSKRRQAPLSTCDVPAELKPGGPTLILARSRPSSAGMVRPSLLPSATGTQSGSRSGGTNHFLSKCLVCPNWNFRVRFNCFPLGEWLCHGEADKQQ
jgi:hypothetical protein